MKTSFSSSDHSRYPKENMIQPLTSQFFSQLIKLEIDFNNKNYTAETLDELTQYYAQAVEYYDSIKDHISAYFIFKIQDTLTTKKSLKLLMQESAKASLLASITEPKESQDLLLDRQGQPDTAEAVSGAAVSSAGEAGFTSASKGKTMLADDLGASRIVETIEDEESSEDDDDEEKEITMIERVRKAEEMKRKKNASKNYASMKNTKQRMFSLQLKLQNEKQAEKQNLKAVLASFSGSSQDNDQVVRTDISGQKDRFREKLSGRKKDSLVNYTHSSAGFFFSKMDNLEGPTMESVLKALDYDESSIHSKEESLYSPIRGNENPLIEVSREDLKTSSP